MTAARLRLAASKLRESAEAATPGPWERFEARGGRSGVLELHGVRSVPIEATGEFDPEISQSIDASDATYIALMSPAVALALADWLDHEVEVMEHYALAGKKFAEGRLLRSRAVADAILGATS
jgi:hypothetical protein